MKCEFNGERAEREGDTDGDGELTREAVRLMYR